MTVLLERVDLDVTVFRFEPSGDPLPARPSSTSTHAFGLPAAVELARVNEIARSEGAACVTQVKVRLGALVPCSADHLREHFIEAARGTVAEGADLVVEVQADSVAPHAYEAVLDSLDIEVES